MAENTGGKVVIRLGVKDADRVKAALRDLGLEGKKAFEVIDEATTPASRSLQLFSGVVEGAHSEMSAMASRLGPLSGAFGILGVGGVAAGAAIAGVSTAAVSTVQSLAELSRQAQTAGLGVEAFQRLRALAIDTGVDIDALVDGIKELQLRTDEFVQTGGGPAAESFKRMGLTADELRRKLRDPAELLLTIVGRLQKLDQAAQVRILDEVFGGTAAERFGALLDKGENGLRSLMTAAQESGRIIDQELVQRAAEIDRKFKTIADTISTNFKGAIVSATVSLAGLMEKLDVFSEKRIADMSDDELQKIARPMQQIGGRSSRPTEVQIPPKIFVGRGTVDNPDYLRQQEAIAELERRRLEAERRLRDQDDEMRRERVRPELIHGPVPIPPDKPSILSLPPDQVDKAQTGVRDHIAELEQELELIGKSNVERRIAIELRRLESEATAEHRTLTADEVQRTRDLVEAIAAADEAKERSVQATEDQIEALRRLNEEEKGLTRDFLGGMLDDLERGVSLVDALSNAFNRLASRLASMVLDQVVEDLFPAPDAKDGTKTARGGGGFITYITKAITEKLGIAPKAQTAPGEMAKIATDAIPNAKLRENLVGTAGPLATGTRLDEAAAWAELKRMGYSDVNAATVLGNMKQESSLNLAALNRDEGAYGSLQWRGDRRQNLDRLADHMGLPANDPRVQLSHFDAEIKGVYGTEGKYGKQFLAATDLEGSNQALKRYIRYGDNSEGTRLAYSKDYFNRFAGDKRQESASQNLEKLADSAQSSASSVGDLGSGAVDAAKSITSSLGDVSKVSAPADALASAGQNLANAGTKAADGASSFTGTLGSLLDGVLGGLGGLFKSLFSIIGSVLNGAGSGGSGFFSSLLSAIGSIFGGTPAAKARGGRFSKQQLLMTGEEGPEIVVPDFSGTIIPAEQSAQMLASAEPDPNRQTTGRGNSARASEAKKAAANSIPQASALGVSDKEWAAASDAYTDIVRSRAQAAVAAMWIKPLGFGWEDTPRIPNLATDVVSGPAHFQYGPGSNFEWVAKRPSLADDSLLRVQDTRRALGNQQPLKIEQHIINNTSAKVTTREESNGRGGRRSVVLIDEAIATATAAPGSRTSQALRANFNITTKTIKR